MLQVKDSPISPASLPKPFATPAADNSSQVIPRLQAPGYRHGWVFGFRICSECSKCALDDRAPNGDVFLAESDSARSWYYGLPKTDPARLGFRPMHLGLRNRMDSQSMMVRSTWPIPRPSGGSPYADGALRSTGKRYMLQPPHRRRASATLTRDIVFDSKGDLFLTIGSKDNLAEGPVALCERGAVNPNGTLTTFASGLRNPVGIAFYPGTDDLYVRSMSATELATGCLRII